MREQMRMQNGSAITLTPVSIYMIGTVGGESEASVYQYDGLTFHVRFQQADPSGRQTETIIPVSFPMEAVTHDEAVRIAVLKLGESTGRRPRRLMLPSQSQQYYISTFQRVRRAAARFLSRLRDIVLLRK